MEFGVYPVIEDSDYNVHVVVRIAYDDIDRCRSGVGVLPSLAGQVSGAIRRAHLDS